MTPGKWAKYGKKYTKEWESENGIKEWIERVAGDDTKAFCRYCKTEIRAHHSDLQNHSKTEKHIRNAVPFSSCRVRTLFDSGITTVRIDRSVKLAELKMAAHIACHSSILTVDHLGELVGEIAQKDIKLQDKMLCTHKKRNRPRHAAPASKGYRGRTVFFSYR